jgi:hypothetical protein
LFKALIDALKISAGLRLEIIETNCQTSEFFHYCGDFLARSKEMDITCIDTLEQVWTPI